MTGMATQKRVSAPVCLGLAVLVTAGWGWLDAGLAQEWSDAAQECYQAEGDPIQAVTVCTLAIDEGGLTVDSLAITFSNRGNSFYDLGQYERAVDDYNMALELAPGDPVTLSNRGAAHLEMGDNELALADLTEALRLYPDNPVALTNRCWIHAIEGRYELAQFDCDEALGLEPLDPIALASRAYVLMQLGDLEGAQRDADLAVRFGEFLWQAHFYRGLAYEAAGDLTVAAENYGRAAELAPDEPGVRQKLAEIGAGGD